MTRELRARVGGVAAKLGCLFESDVELVERLNDAQRRLRLANDRLWSDFCPDALGGGRGERETGSALLAVLQQTHWAIHQAFVDYQSACEERRQLAVDVGELSAQLIEALTAAGWQEEAARSADVHELAKAWAR